ncbi:hypothetical protein [Rubripirellula amarantea]|nr:hypothetical protein [Rubripirellula amarantea]
MMKASTVMNTAVMAAMMEAVLGLGFAAKGEREQGREGEDRDDFLCD